MTSPGLPVRSLSQRGKDLFSRAQEASHVLHPQDLLAKLPFSASGKKTKEARMWTAEEDALLRNAVEKYVDDWEAIANEVPGRNKLQCVQRWKKTLRPGLIKGPWKPEEDALLLQVMSEEMEGDWQAISRRVPGRNAKQCKERWMLNLNPAINHGPWTAEEDAALIDLHAEFGGKWSILAKRLTGRTEHAIKTRFLSLQKRAAKMRSWTVEEDRIVLKQFMLASNLNGVAATMKALPGRTKRQVQERWKYLRETYVSIDDLATSASQGGIALTDHDLRNLIPHPSLNGPIGGNTVSSGLSGLSSSTSSEERTKSLARHQGSSNPNQPFRHAHKRLEKSGSSSSASQRAAAIGSEILNQAYASLPYGSSLFVDQPGMDVIGAPGVEDPFVAGLMNAGLQSPSLFNSTNNPSNEASATHHVTGPLDGSSLLDLSGISRASGGAGQTTVMPRLPSSSSSSAKSLQHNMFSSSFFMPSLSPAPFADGGATRQDSFSVIGQELEQIAAASSGNGYHRRVGSGQMQQQRSPQFAAMNPATAMATSTHPAEDAAMFRAFSGMAPELGGGGATLGTHNGQGYFLDPNSNHAFPTVGGQQAPSTNNIQGSRTWTEIGTQMPLTGLSGPQSEPGEERRLRKFASSSVGGGLDMDIFDTMFNPNGGSARLSGSGLSEQQRSFT